MFAQPAGEQKMTMVTNYNFEQCEQLTVEILDFLRSRNMSYNTADIVLSGAREKLRQVGHHELESLPIADGISYPSTQTKL
jgi:hypothetical protein